MRPDDPPVWYVSRGRERFRLRATVTVRAPRERVFATYVDPALLDRWLGAARIRRIETSPEVLGSSWEAEFEVLHVKLAGVFRVTEAEPPSRVRVEASGPLRSRLWYVTRFEPTGNGTAIDVEGDYQLPYELLSRVPSRLVAEREIERFVAGSHERLKGLLEAPEVPRSSTPKVG